MRPGANLGANSAPRGPQYLQHVSTGHNTFYSSVRHDRQLIDVFAPHRLQGRENRPNNPVIDSSGPQLGK